MPDPNMTVHPEKALAADIIENQPDTKAARLPARYEDGQASETAGSQEIALVRTREIIPAGSQAVIPAGTNDVVSPDPTGTSVDTTPSGPEVIIEPTVTSRRKRKPLLPILAVAAALILVGSLSIWRHFKTYEHAVGLAESGLGLKAADDTIFLPFLTNFHDPEFLTYLEGQVALGDGNYDLCREILQPLADAGYRDSDEVIRLANYRQGRDALNSRDYPLAIQVLKPLAAQDYQNSRELYCEARVSYGLQLVENLTDINDVVDGLNLIRGVFSENYSAGFSALEYAHTIIYEHALNLYWQGNLPDALDYFSQLDNFADSQDYVTLCNTYWGTTTLEELWGLRGFANADDLLLSQYYLCEFLLGAWHTSNNYYYFTMEANTASYAYYCTYNLPWQYTGDFEIIDGVYRVFHNGGATSLSEFRISIDSWDQITIYCYSNGSYHTLYRK